MIGEPTGTLGTLGSRQLTFGPFATINGIIGLICPLSASFDCMLDPFARYPFFFLAFLFLLLTAAGLIAIYLHLLLVERSVLIGNLLVLFVFFMFYPKVHGLYITCLLPLALLTDFRWARWVWVPGVLWMLIVNGAFGATGLVYFFAPVTGRWNWGWFPSSQAAITEILATLQFLLILLSMGEMILRKRLERSLVVSAS